MAGCSRPPIIFTAAEQPAKQARLRSAVASSREDRKRLLRHRDTISSEPSRQIRGQNASLRPVDVEEAADKTEEAQISADTADVRTAGKAIRSPRPCRWRCHGPARRHQRVEAA